MSKPIEINCPICKGTGKVDASDAVITYDYFIQKIARLTSLLTRMSAVGDELAKMTVAWSEWGDSFECDCGAIAPDKTLILHTPDCPVTRWEEIKKEMEE